MSSIFNRSLLRASLLSATAVAGLASPALAADTVLGGGSTLAEPIYAELFTLLPSQTWDYCGVGSGKGQSAVLTNSVAPLIETTLKGADNPVCLSLTNANKPVVFGASDATLSSAQITTFNTTTVSPGKTRLSFDGPLIQVPTLGTPITVPVANSKVTSNSTITLTDDDLCGIYSGAITNWSQSSVSSSVISGPIGVVYRADGSGTSFLFTQHLASVCPNVPTHKTSIFSATTNFGGLFSTVPSNFQSATGSAGVQAALLTDVSSTTTTLVGYLSPDYTAITSTPPTANAKLFVAQLVNGTNGSTYSPTVSATAKALSTANATIPATSTAAANQQNWVPAIANPSTGYPIAGYTTIDTVTCFSPQGGTGNTDFGGDIKALLKNIFTDPTSQGEITGYGFVNLPGPLASAAEAVFITNTSYTANGSTVGPFGLEINDATVCNNIGRSASN